MDEAFVNSHMRFVRALLTTRSEFVQMALEKIVKGFRFRKCLSALHRTRRFSCFLIAYVCSRSFLDL